MHRRKFHEKNRNLQILKLSRKRNLYTCETIVLSRSGKMVNGSGWKICFTDCAPFVVKDIADLVSQVMTSSWMIAVSLTGVWSSLLLLTSEIAGTTSIQSIELSISRVLFDLFDLFEVVIRWWNMNYLTIHFILWNHFWDHLETLLNSTW